MSDDWKVGDLALCVLDCWSPAHRAPNEVNPIYETLAPRKGTTWRVARVDTQFRSEEQREIPYLILEGQPSTSAFHPDYFRKVEEEPESQELIERIKNCGKVSA